MSIDQKEEFLSERDSQCSSHTEGLSTQLVISVPSTDGYTFTTENKDLSARWKTKGMETVTDCMRFHTLLLKAWQEAEGNFYVYNQITCIWHEQELAKIQQICSGAPTAAQLWFPKQEDRTCAKFMEKALEKFK